MHNNFDRKRKRKYAYITIETQDDAMCKKNEWSNILKLKS